MKFSIANAKIVELKKVPELAKFLAGKVGRKTKKVYSFDLLSGYSCPFAKDCLSKVVLIDGKRKIKDGPEMKFRCFSASQEVQYDDVYENRNNNFQELRNMDEFEMTCAIQEVMPDDLGICRIHVAGDFFNQKYFNAWVSIARNNPDKLFYAYTKSLPFWMKRRNDIPENMVLTSSRGGRRDDLIDSENLKEAVVVFSEAQAENLGFDIDHDDSHAARPESKNQSFALMIHGTQASGSDASKALQLLRKNNVKHSYNRKTNPVEKNA